MLEPPSEYLQEDLRDDSDSSLPREVMYMLRSVRSVVSSAVQTADVRQAEWGCGSLAEFIALLQLNVKFRISALRMLLNCRI